ncbi:MAG: zinc ABC transporter substrate-binding protein [Pseudobacteriovorax sp.]|nr:zinc ABC transporter substrate-binding protein [Pseudobacteriovorax sp.]
MKHVFLITSALLFLLYSSYGLAKDKIFVSFYPLEYAVQSLVGDKAEIWNPVDSDPAEWKPSKSQITEMQKAKLIVINGAKFEKWKKVVSLPKSKLVDTARPFRKTWLHYHDKHAKPHRHGNKVHTHKGTDGHTWMSPKRFLKQIDTLYRRLGRAAIVDQKTLDANYQKLKAAVTELDSSWQAAGKKLKTSGPVFANHPAYNYLAKDYGFKVHNFHVTPDVDFTDKEKKEISAAVAKKKGKLFWWESAPNETNRKFIEDELKLTSLVVSPSEIQGPKDFIATMRANVQQL